MNQEKVGSFIAQCRKEKNFTQSQLAEKLNMSNKTISKWETGRGMPDSSIMLELCDLLGITVNELLSGEHLKKEDYDKKADENIIYMAKESDKNKKKRKKVTIIFSTIIIIFVLLLIGIQIYNTAEITLEYDARIIKCEINDNIIVCKIQGSSLVHFEHKEINTENETFVFFTGKMYLSNKIRSHFETWHSMAQLINNENICFSSAEDLEINKDIANCKSKIKVYYTKVPLNKINSNNLNEILEQSYLMCEN